MKQVISSVGRTFGLIGAGSGAVVEREMRAQGRRWGTYIARSLVAALLLAAFVVSYIAVSEDASYHTGAQRVQSLQHFAPALSIGVLWIQFAIVVLVAPVLTGPSICDERRTGTLAALLTTPLSAAHIVLGKLLGATLQLVVLALLPAPLLLVVRVFGGVDAEVVLAGFVLSMSMGLLAAALGVFFSTRLRRGTAAGAAGLISVLALHAVPSIVMAILIGTRTYAIPYNFAFASSSPTVLGLLSMSVFGQLPPVPFSLRLCWISSAGYSLVLAFLVIAWTIVSLRRVMTNFEESAASAAPKAERVGRVGEQGAAVRSGRAVGDRPVLWREVRQPFFGSWKKAALVLAAIAGILVWAYSLIWKYNGTLDEEVVHGFTLVIGTLISLILAAVLPAGLVGIERESRTLDTLLTSRLSPWQIVSGKAVGALRRQIFFPCVVLAELAFGAFVVLNVRPAMLLHFVMLIVPTIFFLGCTGVLAGTLVRRSVHAMVANLGLAIVLWIGLPLALVMLTELSSRRSFLSAAVFEHTLQFLNPVYMIVSAADRGVFAGSDSTRPLTYSPFDNALSLGEFTSLLLAFGGIYTATGLGVLRLAALRLRKQFAGA